MEEICNIHQFLNTDHKMFGLHLLHSTEKIKRKRVNSILKLSYGNSANKSNDFGLNIQSVYAIFFSMYSLTMGKSIKSILCPLSFKSRSSDEKITVFKVRGSSWPCKL